MDSVLWYPGLELDEKAPNDVVIIKFEWADKLGTDTISAASYAADVGITVEVESFTTDTVFLRLSGGTAGDYYNVTAIIDTPKPQHFERSVSVPVEPL